MRQHLTSFGKGDRIPAVHLFGIDNGNDLERFPVAECKALAESSGLKASLGTELHKGVRLSKYVRRV